MLSMLLSRKLDERKARLINERRRLGREEVREERRKEVRAACDAEWNAWLERMLAAQAEGEPFEEPPPSHARPRANGKA